MIIDKAIHMQIANNKKVELTPYQSQFLQNEGVQYIQVDKTGNWINRTRISINEELKQEKHHQKRNCKWKSHDVDTIQHNMKHVKIKGKESQTEEKKSRMSWTESPTLKIW